MLHVVDRVAETTTTTGTGPFSLEGALTSCIRFNAIPNIAVGDFVEYLSEAVDGNGIPTGAWEAGIGTYSAANTLTRTTVLASSNSNNAVDFATGTKYVYLSPIARQFGTNRARWMFYETDFLGAASADTGEATYAIWDLSLISSGTQAKQTAAADHPGVLRISSSATANSGAFVRSAVDAFLIAGGEFSEFIIRPQTLTNTMIRAGFIDTGTSTAPTDGVFFEINAGATTGICRSNNTQTSTSTLVTMSTNTWYRLWLRVNLAATEARFIVFNENGTVAGSGTVASNIPTAAGRETGHGIIATNSGTTAVALVDIDYQSVGILRRLVR